MHILAVYKQQLGNFSCTKIMYYLMRQTQVYSQSSLPVSLFRTIQIYQTWWVYILTKNMRLHYHTTNDKLKHGLTSKKSMFSATMNSDFGLFSQYFTYMYKRFSYNSHQIQSWLRSLDISKTADIYIQRYNQDHFSTQRLNTLRRVTTDSCLWQLSRHLQEYYPSIHPVFQLLYTSV